MAVIHFTFPSPLNELLSPINAIVPPIEDHRFPQIFTMNVALFLEERSDIGESFHSEPEIYKTFYYLLDHQRATYLGSEQNPQVRAFVTTVFEAKKGSVKAIHSIAMAYLRGEILPQSTQRALPLLREAALKRYPDALYTLAILFLEENCREVIQSDEQLLQILLIASRKGHRCARNLLIRFFEEDLQMSNTSIPIVESYYQIFIEEGESKALYWLASFYFDCQQYKTALRLLTNCAYSGDSEAFFFLGKLHYEGNIVERNLSKAKQYFHIAAEQGHAEAQYAYGKMLLKATGNNKEGLSFIQAAAHQGHQKALQWLNMFNASHSLRFEMR